MDENAKLDGLIGDAYEIVAFRDLPETHQLAMAWWMALDGEAWELDTPGVTASVQSAAWYAGWKAEIHRNLPHLIEQYGDTPFGLVTIETEPLIQSIGTDDAIQEDGGDAEGYRQGTLSVGHSMPYPEHGDSDRWPVILSSTEDETLQDGWKRFATYVRQGATSVPALFYPAERHLQPRTAPKI